MGVQVLNPQWSCRSPELYRQVAVASGSRTVYLAGTRCARDADGRAVGGGDLAAAGRAGVP